MIFSIKRGDCCCCCCSRQAVAALFPVCCSRPTVLTANRQRKKKRKKSSWQGEACFGRFLPANRLSGSRPNLRNCHRPRLHVEVFGSGLSELRAQLAHGHALTYTRTHASTRARTHAALSPDLHRRRSFQVRSWRRVPPLQSRRTELDPGCSRGGMRGHRGAQ